MAIQNVTDAYVLAQTAGDTYNGDSSDQTYSINPNLVGAGDTITIIDQGGNNAIELPAGLEITSSQTISDQTILTLSNGAVVDIRGADTFTFNVGQNQAAGDTAGTDLSFEDFATNILGVTVPADGDPVVDGGSSTVNDDGTADTGDGGDGGDGGTPGDDLTLTTDTDILLAAEADLPDGLTEADVARTTTDDDVIEAVASGLTSERTLNPADQIDGDAGTDTLEVTQSGNFTGFTGDGGMTNVENIDITNTSSLSRSFDASGVDGVEAISIDANDQNYTLSDLAAPGISVSAMNMDDDTLTIGFASGATDGSSDALTVVAEDLGDSDNDVTVDAAGIEELTIESNGAANFLDLNGGADMTTVTATGEADLSVTNVATSLTEADGSAATGDLTLDLSGATAMESASSGTGDDTVTVDGGFVVDASFDGGEGEDTLAIENSLGTKQPTITGFETLALTNVDGTIAGENVDGVETLSVQDGLGGDLLVADVVTPALTVELAQTDGGTYGAGNELTYTTATDLTVSTANEDADAAANAAIADDVTANTATSLVVDVASWTDLTGAVTANAATSATVNVAEDAALTGSVTADAATDATLDFGSAVAGALSFGDATTVTLTSTEAQGTLDLQADSAQSLSIDSSAATVLAGAAANALAGLESLNLQGIGRFDGGTALGGESSSVTVDATTVKEDNGANASVIVDVANFADGGGQVVFNGSTLQANTLTIGTGRNEVIATGGIEDDTVTYNTVIGATDEASIDIDLGSTSTGDTLALSANAYDFTSANVTLSGVDNITTATAITVNASVISGQTIDFNAGVITLEGTSGADTIDMSGFTFTGGSTQVNGSDGADTITASNGDDVFSYTAESQFGDTINNINTSGTDVLNLDVGGSAATKGANLFSSAAAKTTALKTLDVVLANGNTGTAAGALATGDVFTLTATGSGAFSDALLAVTAKTAHTTAGTFVAFGLGSAGTLFAAQLNLGSSAKTAKSITSDEIVEIQTVGTVDGIGATDIVLV